MIVHLFLIIWGLGFGGIPLGILLSGDAEGAGGMLAIFIIIGMGAFIFGVVGVMKVLLAVMFGKPKYAVLVDIVDSGVRVNGVPQMNGVFAYFDDPEINELEIHLSRSNSRRFNIGDMASVKVYKKQGSLLEFFRTDTRVPSHIAIKLREYCDANGAKDKHTANVTTKQTTINLSDLSSEDRQFLGSVDDLKEMMDQVYDDAHGTITCQNCGAMINERTCKYCGFVHARPAVTKSIVREGKKTVSFGKKGVTESYSEKTSYGPERPYEEKPYAERTYVDRTYSDRTYSSTPKRYKEFTCHGCGRKIRTERCMYCGEKHIPTLLEEI